MDNQLYCGYETRVHCCYSSIIYLFFFLFLFHILNCCVTISQELFKLETVNWVYIWPIRFCIVGWTTGLTACISPLNCPFLSFQCKSVTIFSGTIQVRVFHLGINLKKKKKTLFCGGVGLWLTALILPLFIRFSSFSLFHTWQK